MKIDHVQIAVPAGTEDLCRAFWVDILGFDEVAKPKALQSRGGAWFCHGTTHIHLGVDPEFAAAKKAHPAFIMPKIDGLADTLAAAGFPVQWDDKINGRRRFFTDDPVGNRIEFIEDT